MRRLLRAIARGEEITQDISTLENPAIIDQLRGVDRAALATTAARKASRKRAAPGKAEHKQETSAAYEEAAQAGEGPDGRRAGKDPPDHPAAQRETQVDGRCWPLAARIGACA